jgi:lipoate-protein ligase A
VAGADATRRTPQEDTERHEELLRVGTVAYAVAVLDRPALSIGIGVSPAADFVQRAREGGLTVVRRTTGGSGVLLGEGDVTWAVVLPRGDPRIGPSLTAAYARLGAPLLSVLARHGIGGAWVPSPGRSLGCCLLGGRGRVLAIDRGVLSGAAQHLTRQALLHHGTLPRRVDRAAHRAVFDGEDRAAFDRLIGTRDLGIAEEPETVRDELARAFAQLLETG